MCLQLTYCFQKLGWCCPLCPPVWLYGPYCVFRYDSGIKNDVRFVFAPSCSLKDSYIIYVICICFSIVVPNMLSHYMYFCSLFCVVVSLTMFEYSLFPVVSRESISYEYHDRCPIRGRNCLTVDSTFVHLRGLNCSSR